jgi:hypothetical protein
MKMEFPDTPAGRFTAKSVNAARALALNFANRPDAEVHPRLEEYLAGIEPEFLERFGAEFAAKYINGFRRAVLGHRRDIEESGSTSLQEFMKVVTR